MNTKIKKIKLSEGDKKIITTHSNICTDSHGKGCGLINLKELTKLTQVESNINGIYIS